MLATLLRRPSLRPFTGPAVRPVRASFRGFAAAEALESRVVLSAVSAAAAPPVDAAAAADTLQATITDVSVTGVDLVNGVVDATVSGSVLGQTFTDLPVQIPLEVGATDGGTDPATGDPACDILNLSLGPVNLDVLGLVVNLDDCDGGPVTVDITGQEGPGNLLGNLVCDVAGLLDGGLDLGGILGGLTGDALTQLEGQIAQLEGDLTTLLDDVLGQLTGGPIGGGVGAALAGGNGGGGNGGGGNSTDLLHLEVPDPGVDLNLLGLNVDTSAICLTVSAQSGGGNLLGNLLGSVAHLADGTGNGSPLNAIAQKLDRIEALLGDAGAVDGLLNGGQGNGKAKGKVA